MLKQNLNRLIFLFLLGSFFWSLTSCDPLEEKKNLTGEYKKVPGFLYDLEHPDTIYQLPKDLKEISGIDYFKKDRIACIQDEKGNIYIFDTKKGKVISKLDFGKDGDYEDVAIVGDDAYVLRSDGTLFEVRNFEKKPKKTKKFNTPLHHKNNTEGLFYDEARNSLLIACKGSPSIKKEKSYAGFKAVYRFDLELKTLIEKPVYLIDFAKIDSAKAAGSVTEFFTKIAMKLKLSNGSNFYPSGLAIHPLDKDKIYMLSSIGKLLLVMDTSGKLLNIIELDMRIFNQPEGICFSEDGVLFISNEADSGGGNILKFTPTTNTLKKH